MYIAPCISQHAPPCSPPASNAVLSPLPVHSKPSWLIPHWLPNPPENGRIVIEEMETSRGWITHRRCRSWSWNPAPLLPETQCSLSLLSLQDSLSPVLVVALFCLVVCLFLSKTSPHYDSFTTLKFLCLIRFQNHFSILIPNFCCDQHTSSLFLTFFVLSMTILHCRLLNQMSWPLRNMRC